MNRVIREEVYDPFADDEPLKNPFEGVFDDAPDADDTPAPPDGARTTPAETFAERKARLTLEREQARLDAADKDHGTSSQADSTAAGKEPPADPDMDGKGGEREA